MFEVYRQCGMFVFFLVLLVYTNEQYIYNDQSLALLVFRDRVTVVEMSAVLLATIEKKSLNIPNR